MKAGSRSVRGFTLIELLVVMAIIGILISLLMPAIFTALENAHMADTLNNGRSICQALLASEHLGRNSVFPASSGAGAFATSTDYWKWVITNEVLDSTFQVFAAHGTAVYKGMDPAQFNQMHNAWCVTADLGPTTRGMVPVLFTRNLNIARLDQDPVAGLTQDVPYGRSGVIVVMRDNSANIRREDSLLEAFNPAGASNVVLRP